MATRGRDGGGGEKGLEKGGQRYKFPITRYINTRVIMYNMKIIVDIAVHYI